MTWDYQRFHRNPVAAERLETRGRNTIILHYHCRVDTELGKLFLVLVGLNVHVHPVFINLINIGYQLLLYNLNQGMPVLKIVTITKYLNITIIASS